MWHDRKYFLFYVKDDAIYTSITGHRESTNVCLKIACTYTHVIIHRHTIRHLTYRLFSRLVII